MTTVGGTQNLDSGSSLPSRTRKAAGAGKSKSKGRNNTKSGQVVPSPTDSRLLGKSRVTYREFLEIPQVLALHADDGVELTNAEILHELFCFNEECDWDEEEDALALPEFGMTHSFWEGLAERFENAGITMEMAIEHQEAVLDLLGVEYE